MPQESGISPIILGFFDHQSYSIGRGLDSQSIISQWCSIFFGGGAKSRKIIAKKQLHLFDPVISLHFMILETGMCMLKLHFGLPVTFAFHTSSDSTFVTDPVPCGYVLRAKRLGLWGVYMKFNI